MYREQSCHRSAESRRDVKDPHPALSPDFCMGVWVALWMQIRPLLLPPLEKSPKPMARVNKQHLFLFPVSVFLAFKLLGA